MGSPSDKTIAWLQQRGELPDSFPVKTVSSLPWLILVIILWLTMGNSVVWKCSEV